MPFETCPLDADAEPTRRLNKRGKETARVELADMSAENVLWTSERRAEIVPCSLCARGSSGTPSDGPSASSEQQLATRCTQSIWLLSSWNHRSSSGNSAGEDGLERSKHIVMDVPATASSLCSASDMASCELSSLLARASSIWQ